MADNYLEFSEVIPHLTGEEEAWLRKQLQCVYDFHDDHDTRDGWGRHLWLYAEESADLEKIAHLVQKFLRQFRPQDCWSLTYAAGCSKPRVGEFGGGAVFVTADEVKWQNAHDFVETHSAAFRKKTSPGSTCSASAIQSYDLIIGEPDLRTQRGMLLRLAEALHRGKRPQLAPDDVEPLEGLINLTDAIADQAADHYGIDCLLPVSEGSDTGDVEDESRQERERLIRQAEANGVKPEQLDELVHDMASSHAATINNGGLPTRFIIATTSKWAAIRRFRFPNRSRFSS